MLQQKMLTTEQLVTVSCRNIGMWVVTINVENILKLELQFSITVWRLSLTAWQTEVTVMMAVIDIALGWLNSDTHQ